MKPQTTVHRRFGGTIRPNTAQRMRPCRAKSTQRLRHFVAGTACRSAPMRKRYTTRWDPVSCKLLIGNLSDSFFVFCCFLVFRFSHKHPCLSGPGQAVHIGPHYDVGGSCSHPLVAQSRGPRADCNSLFEFISNQTSLPPLACLACHPTPCNGCSRGAQTLKSRPGRERRGLGPRPTAGPPSSGGLRGRLGRGRLGRLLLGLLLFRLLLLLLALALALLGLLLNLRQRRQPVPHDLRGRGAILGRVPLQLLGNLTLGIQLRQVQVVPEAPSIPAELHAVHAEAVPEAPAAIAGGDRADATLYHVGDVGIGLVPPPALHAVQDVLLESQSGFALRRGDGREAGVAGHFLIALLLLTLLALLLLAILFVLALALALAELAFSLALAFLLTDFHRHFHHRCGDHLHRSTLDVLAVHALDGSLHLISR
mmetsp:Transcript_95014/g.268490  ORF Transcript_95014/g.268490 Transcript_95014/m.268490 type:complete len:424 (+) Transcript_95014:16-1287(+)